MRDGNNGVSGGGVPGVRAANWTVLGEDYATVGPIEEWIEAHRHLWSPNTVRGYATRFGQWWTFRELHEEVAGWRDVGVPAITAYLSWQRNGRTVEHSLAESGEVPTLRQWTFVWLP